MVQETHLYVKKLSDKAQLPVRGSAHAAGYDLFRSMFLIQFGRYDDSCQR
jgi:dUTPase